MRRRRYFIIALYINMWCGFTTISCATRAKKEGRLLALPLFLVCFDYLPKCGFLFRCQYCPFIKEFPQLRRNLNHFALCKKLCHGNAERLAQCFQCDHARSVATAVDVGYCVRR
nr:MAG TPA: hypothetical protein [Caudoviricetes sp.]